MAPEIAMKGIERPWFSMVFNALKHVFPHEVKHITLLQVGLER